MILRAAGAALAALAAAGLLLAPAAQASARSVQVSGNQLKSALLPAADFGRGFKSSPAVTSGGSLLNQPALGRISGLSCASFEVAPGVGTFGQTAYALRAIFNPKPSPDLSTDVVYVESVVQFGSATVAASYFSQAYAKYAKCKDFTEAVPANLGLGRGGSLKTTLASISRTSVGAYRAFRVGQSSEVSVLPGVSLKQDTLAALAGTDVYYLVSIGGTGERVPAALMGDQISRVQELR
jgi:hypothetical protein